METYNSSKYVIEYSYLVATELFLTGKDVAQIERLRKLPPLERLGQPEDIANLVSFLAGPDGGWVNGQVLQS
jgi:3-oxoacyl-[acyl-carrier protein] reductase